MKQREVSPSGPSPPQRPPQTLSNEPFPSTASPGSYPSEARSALQTPVRTHTHTCQFFQRTGLMEKRHKRHLRVQW